MSSALIGRLIELRLTVGFIGESTSPPWWRSSFLAATSRAFLTPVLGRTALVAQLHGVSRAAALVHDAHIGTGRNVYHLFRLPEEVEQQIHGRLCQRVGGDEAGQVPSTRDEAMTRLKALAAAGSGSGAGPLRIGSSAELARDAVWAQVAACYACALEAGEQVFPFFAESLRE